MFGVHQTSPHSPIGRDRGLKILVFWVRVPVGALVGRQTVTHTGRRSISPREWTAALCCSIAAVASMRRQNNVPDKETMPPTHTIGGIVEHAAVLSSPRVDKGRALPGSARPGGEAWFDYRCLVARAGYRVGGRKSICGRYLRRAKSASMENLPAPVKKKATAIAARVRTYS